MIVKLRRKIIALTMSLLTLVLALVCVGVYVSSRRTIEARSTEQLQSALRGYDTSLPMFFAEVLPSGTVRISGSDYYDLHDNQTLLAIVRECLSQRSPNGLLKGYHLRYCRQSGLTERIAFMDCGFETSTLHSLTGTLLLIGAGALLALFGCAYALSGLITRPVARAWDEQKQFLSDAGHELKTPLTVILSSAELLHADTAEETGRLDNIRSEGRRMKQLVESMLTLSRVEHLPKEALSNVDISDLTEQAVLSFEPVAFEAGHRLSAAIAPELCVRGSSEQLYQAMSILLDNAVKYAQADTPIHLMLHPVGKNAVLSVENCATPIPPAQLSHLFDRFYRADASRSTEGFGLGLAIALRIAQSHRGTLNCQSDARATVFTLSLPCIHPPGR